LLFKVRAKFSWKILFRKQSFAKGSILHSILIMNVTKISKRIKYLSLNKEKVPIYSKSIIEILF